MKAESLKQCCKVLKDTIINAELFDPADDGFKQLKSKIDNYFFWHTAERNTYKDELAFINREVSKIAENEKLLYSVMPYPFALEYDSTAIKVFRDEKAGLYYVLHDGRRLYYHSGFKSVESVQKSFTYISVEQHPGSPHCYMDNGFTVKPDDVVADFGSAEGNFSLSVIERVKKIFIVEPEQIWMEALVKTFEPWKEKVVIINKYVSDEPDQRSITLESLFGDHLPNMIKMDIEGSELSVLKSAKNLLANSTGSLAIATYHRHTDEQLIRVLLEDAGYTVENSSGYMLFVYDRLRPPYFRKGLIRAFKSL